MSFGHDSLSLRDNGHGAWFRMLSTVAFFSLSRVNHFFLLSGFLVNCLKKIPFILYLSQYI